MGEARKGGRSAGKSDAIDALAVARAALRERGLPQAFLAGPEREIKLLLDHRDDLVAERTRIQSRLRWHLHDLDPELAVPAGALDRYCWLDRIERLLAGQAQTAQVRIAAELVSRCRELTRRVKQLERELQALVEQQAAPLLELNGCGVLTAAKLIAEVAGVHRFPSDAQLAKHGGSAPLPASSGTRQRHRLNRHGNRQLNCALHRIAVNQGRRHPPARAYLARKEAEGKNRKEALRCLKRHLARTVLPHAQIDRGAENDGDQTGRLRAGLDIGATRGPPSHQLHALPAVWLRRDEPGCAGKLMTTFRLELAISGC
jgi:transposase